MNKITLTEKERRVVAGSLRMFIHHLNVNLEIGGTPEEEKTAKKHVKDSSSALLKFEPKTIDVEY